MTARVPAWYALEFANPRGLSECLWGDDPEFVLAALLHPLMPQCQLEDAAAGHPAAWVRGAAVSLLGWRAGRREAEAAGVDESPAPVVLELW